MHDFLYWRRTRRQSALNAMPMGKVPPAEAAAEALPAGQQNLPFRRIVPALTAALTTILLGTVPDIEASVSGRATLVTPRISVSRQSATAWPRGGLVVDEPIPAGAIVLSLPPRPVFPHQVAAEWPRGGIAIEETEASVPGKQSLTQPRPSYPRHAATEWPRGGLTVDEPIPAGKALLSLPPQPFSSHQIATEWPRGGLAVDEPIPAGTLLFVFPKRTERLTFPTSDAWLQRRVAIEEISTPLPEGQRSLSQPQPQYPRHSAVEWPRGGVAVVPPEAIPEGTRLSSEHNATTERQTHPAPRSWPLGGHAVEGEPEAPPLGSLTPHSAPHPYLYLSLISDGVSPPPEDVPPVQQIATPYPQYPRQRAAEWPRGGVVVSELVEAPPEGQQSLTSPQPKYSRQVAAEWPRGGLAFEETEASVLGKQSLPQPRPVFPRHSATEWPCGGLAVDEPIPVGTIALSLPPQPQYPRQKASEWPRGGTANEEIEASIPGKQSLAQPYPKYPRHAAVEWPRGGLAVNEPLPTGTLLFVFPKRTERLIFPTPQTWIQRRIAIEDISTPLPEGQRSVSQPHPQYPRQRAAEWPRGGLAVVEPTEALPEGQRSVTSPQPRYPRQFAAEWPRGGLATPEAIEAPLGNALFLPLFPVPSRQKAVEWYRSGPTTEEIEASVPGRIFLALPQRFPIPQRMWHGPVLTVDEPIPPGMVLLSREFPFRFHQKAGEWPRGGIAVDEPIPAGSMLLSRILPVQFSHISAGWPRGGIAVEEIEARVPGGIVLAQPHPKYPRHSALEWPRGGLAIDEPLPGGDVFFALPYPPPFHAIYRPLIDQFLTLEGEVLPAGQQLLSDPRRVRRQQAGYDQFGFPVGAYIEEGAAATVVYIVKKTGIFLAGARQQQVFLAGACQQQVFLAGVQAAQAKGEG